MYILLLPLVALASTANATPVPKSNLSSHQSVATSNPFGRRATFNVRVAAATCAAVSMTACCVAFYWFYRMEKRFRHRLIMILIFGDLIKTTWLFIFAIVSMYQGTVFTTSSFCQASGFFIQYGLETSDYAVLVISIHGAFQVFRPSVVSQNDGLYKYRNIVYAGAFILPMMMASLAFINPHWGYMSVGAFCGLPIRPFWYRLALNWIPRYIVAVVILALAIAIYAHVGFEFRAFSRYDHQHKTSLSTATPMLSVAGDADAATIPESSRAQSMDTQAFKGRRPSSVMNDMVSLRRPSTVMFETDLIRPPHTPLDLESRAQSAPPEILPVAPVPPSMHVLSDLALSSFKIQPSKPDGSLENNPSSSLSALNTPAAIAEEHAPSPFSDTAQSPIQRQLIRQRARIHRQLRLMFIYPLVYVLMWLVPFIMHCMNYDDRWAAHPVYWLSFLATICITLMGAVDCLIFSLRERPWRHIPHSDGSFRGSFLCWRTEVNPRPRVTRPSEALQRALTETAPYNYFSPSATVIEQPVKAKVPGFPNIMDMVPRVRSSGGSDSQRAAAGLARERLEKEKEDRLVGWRSRSRVLGGAASRHTLDGIDSRGEEEAERLDVVGGDAEKGKEKESV